MFVLFVGDFVFKMTPKHSLEKLCSVPKHKKVMVCPTERICALDKPHSGLNYNAAGCKFNVNESSIIYRLGQK